MMSFSFFKTFAEIHRHSKPLHLRLSEYECYFAHLQETKDPEPLSEHVELVAEYALKLIDVHHLDAVVDRLIYSLVNCEEITSQENVGNFVKTLFWDAILFHDYGKINENFQVERMQNPHFRRNPKNQIGARHSVLSAVLFIADHVQRLLGKPQFSPSEQNILGTLTLIFSSVILKHHASYLEHELNILPEWIDSLQSYLELLGIHVDLQLLKNSIGHFQNEQEFLNLIDTLFKNIPPFPLYALLRLCYSLLTASDYYATSAYTMNLHVNDFGIFSPEQKEQLQKQFWNGKTYNKEFFDKRVYFESIPEKTLRERSPQNLNLLRQKLMAEILNSVQNNKEEYVLYLEAPTGAGKTNLSLAIALELLNYENKLNKIFYVFPFTTLITQTARSIRETLNITSEQMIQLHSRSGFHSRREEKQDGQYGNEYLNYVDNLFVNYPLVLMTHIKFFDILKNNEKENTYLLHRLANSVVIIDELQSYPPEEWDKIAYFISNYAYFFNIRFILMSATLPKLDALEIPGKEQLPLPKQFVPLIPNSARYFQNPNFRGRVQFDFSFLADPITTEDLADKVFEKCEEYAREHNGRVKGIIEFIFKRRAGEFYELVKEKMENAGYEVLLLSGTILEPRRKEIIERIQEADHNGNLPCKLLLITTQVVEAGVDIDMNIGFKDRSLIDSDEQLAGRVNRNARSVPATVYLFQLDRAYAIYGKDLRYKITRDTITNEEYQDILQNKRFDSLYKKVSEYINRENSNEYIRGIRSFLDHLKYLRFSKVDWEFQLISDKTITVYVPLKVSVHYFSEKDLNFLLEFGVIIKSEMVSGVDVWKVYEDIISMQGNSFIAKRIDLKRIYGIMSQFMFSLYSNSFVMAELKRYANLELFDKYNILYLSDWKDVYDYYSGIREQVFSDPMVFF